MNNVAETVENILTNYSEEETLIQTQLQAIQSQRLELLQDHPTRISLKFDTREDVAKTMRSASKRNKALKRELNIAMGKLRSKQYYNPAEDNLKKMIEKYSKVPSREDEE